MKRKTSIADALVPDPDLLVLDVPASGLDPYAQRTVEALLRDLSAEGKTVLLSSHHLGRVRRLSDRVGILRDGEMVRETDMDGQGVYLEELYFSILEDGP